MKCTNGDKVAYRDLETAKEARKTLMYKDKDRFSTGLHIYQCPYCNKYHLTKRDY